MDLMLGLEPSGTRAVFSPLTVGLGLGARTEVGASLRVGARAADSGGGAEAKHHLIDAQGFRPGLALGAYGDAFNGRTRAGPRLFGSTERVSGWALNAVAGADWAFKTARPVSPALGVAASLVRKKVEVVAEVTHLYGGLLLGGALRYAVGERQGAMVGVDWQPSTRAILLRLGVGFSTAGANTSASRDVAPPEDGLARKPPPSGSEPAGTTRDTDLGHGEPRALVPARPKAESGSRKDVLPSEPEPPLPSSEKSATAVEAKPESASGEPGQRAPDLLPPVASPSLAPAGATPEDRSVPLATIPAADATAARSERLRDGDAGKLQIRAAILSHETDIRRCVEGTLKRDPTFAGEGNLDLTVDARGKISSAGFSKGSLRKTALEACLQKTASEWRFPFSGRPYEVSVPLSVRGETPW